MATRARAPGFGALFAFGLAKALAEHPLNEAELILPVLSGPEAPTHCPACSGAVSGASRDENGDWTWCCFGGCNP